MGLKKAFTADQKWAIYTIKEGMKPGLEGTTTDRQPFEELVDMKILKRGEKWYEAGERFSEHQNLSYFRDTV